MAVAPPVLQQSLDVLNRCSVRVSQNYAYPEHGQAPINIAFSNGARLRADYWRLSKGGRARLSSFDHKQQYGLPAPIDAIGVLKDELHNAWVTEAWHDPETGDLLLAFSNGVKLQILNFTGYDIWEIIFPDGTREYSNYAK